MLIYVKKVPKEKTLVSIWYALNWRITLVECWIWSEKVNSISGTEMDWKDRQEMWNGSWYTHDLKLTT